MALTRQHQRELVEAIAAWMRFEVLCGHEKFLGEAILAYPLVQFFAAHGYALDSEVNYPRLNRKLGRPQSVDYVIMGRKHPSGYLEVKYKVELLLGDVIRLWEVTGIRLLLLATVEQLGEKWWKQTSTYLPTEEGKTGTYHEGSQPGIKHAHDDWLKKLETGRRRKRKYRAELVALHKPLPQEREPVTVALWRIFDWEKPVGSGTGVASAQGELRGYE